MAEKKDRNGFWFFAGNPAAALMLWAVFSFFARPAAAFFFAYSLTFVVFLIAGREFKSMLTTMGCSFAYLVFLELLQKTGWILGTFRCADLAAEAAGCAAAGTLILCFLKSGRRTGNMI